MFQESAATVCDRKAIFAGGGEFDLTWQGWASGSDVIDIYDSYTDTWSVEHMTKPLVMHACAGAEDHFLVAGGLVYVDPDSLYLTSNVEIFTDPDCYVGIGDEQEDSSSHLSINVYPNPTHGIVDFRWSIFDGKWTMDNGQWTILKVFNTQGQEVATLLDGMCYGDQVIRWDMSGLPAGIYYYRTSTIDNRPSTMGKIVKY